jgi:predicted RNA-binding protein (virulence factor B family)
MVEIGKLNSLVIKSIDAGGIWLDGGTMGDIHLLEKVVPGRYQKGDELEAFVYVSRDDELCAITSKPYAVVGQFAVLQVVATPDAGAFLSWGMKDDLLVPKSEQLSPMEVAKSYVVYLFVSRKTNRITASSKLDQFLGHEPAPYQEGDEVDLLVFDHTDFGYRAVINQSHVGMIYSNEVFRKLSLGDHLRGYIHHIREDLKIDLRLQQGGYDKVDGVSQSILDVLKENGGSVPVSDKSPPDDIYALFGVSKKVFKKAIGSLYKKRIIRIDKKGIEMVKNENS